MKIKKKSLFSKNSVEWEQLASKWIVTQKSHSFSLKLDTGCCGRRQMSHLTPPQMKEASQKWHKLPVLKDMLKSTSGLSKIRRAFLVVICFVSFCFRLYGVDTPQINFAQLSSGMMLSAYIEGPKMKHFSETHHCSYKTLSCVLWLTRGLLGPSGTNMRSSWTSSEFPLLLFFFSIMDVVYCMTK